MLFTYILVTEIVVRHVKKLDKCFWTQWCLIISFLDCTSRQGYFRANPICIDLRPRRGDNLGGLDGGSNCRNLICSSNAFSLVCVLDGVRVHSDTWQIVWVNTVNPFMFFLRLVCVLSYSCNPSCRQHRSQVMLITTNIQFRIVITNTRIINASKCVPYHCVILFVESMTALN